MPSLRLATDRSPSRVRKLRLLPLLAATYFMVSGGPYDLEDVIGFGGYGGALLLLFLLPFFWSFPTARMWGELAAAVPAATSRDDLVATVHALDRVLMSGHYMIPLYYLGSDNIAYWQTHIQHPASMPLYGTVLESWWSAKP